MGRGPPYVVLKLARMPKRKTSLYAPSIHWPADENKYRTKVKFFE